MLLNGLNRDMNGPSKICGRQPLKKFESDMVCLGRPYHFKLFKGCLLQILLGPFISRFRPFSNIMH